MTEGFVYLIENPNQGVVKIGFSVDPERRLKSLQTGAAAPLRIIYRVRGTTSLEAALHRRFQAYHFMNEWFWDDPSIRRWFARHCYVPFWKVLLVGIVGEVVLLCTGLGLIRNAFPHR